MTITCKNCNSAFKGNFCPTCGQAANTHRLDLHSVWHDIEHGLLHVDKGLVYTIIQLFTRPGHAIREYIAGKRVKHFRPVSMVIILAIIYALLNHYFHINMIVETENELKMNLFGLDFNIQVQQGETSYLKEIKDFIESHFAMLQLVFLPFFAGASRLAFRKTGYNYIEHFMINAFLRGQALILGMLFLPFIYFGWMPREMATNVVSILQIVCLFWAFMQIFNTERKFRVVKRTLLAVLYFVIEIVLAVSVVLVIINLFS